MNKKRYLQLAFLLLLIVATVLIIRQQHNMPYQKNSGFVFGTVYNVSYQWDRDLSAEIEAELKRVDAEFSMFNPHSVVTAINNGEQPSLSNMFIEVFEMASSVNKETGGAFDITVAPLVNAWGFGFKNEKMPTREQVDSLKRLIGFQKIKLSRDHRHLVKEDPRLTLDFSAIAKGYGSDVVASLLRKYGVANYMVEIGGEVVTCGLNPQRLPWRIGVTKPNDDSLNASQEMQTVLNVTDMAMATSGNYRNFYYKGGKKYAHTIDPKTGYPVQHNILSATVLAKSCAVADAYATAFMVMGLDKARQTLEKHPELMAYFIYTDQSGEFKTWFSPSMKGKYME